MSAFFLSQDHSKSSSLIKTLAVLCASIITIFFYSITTNDLNVGMTSDDAMYLLMAEAYSPWADSQSLLLDYIRGIKMHPPFYPIVLGLLGVTADTPVLATYLTVGFLLLGLLLIAIWIKHETNDGLLGIVLAVVFAFMPFTILLSQELWSEFLYIALFYGLLICLGRVDKTHNDWLLAALLVAILSITRSIGLSAILAFCLILVFARPKRFLLYMAISVMPFAYWHLWQGLTSRNSNYFSTGADHLLGSIGQLWDYSVEYWSVTWSAWVWLFDPLAHYPYLAQFVCGVLLLLAFIGFCHRFMQRRLDAYYLVFYLAILMAWPYNTVFFITRFIYPLLPLLLFYAWLGSHQFWSNRQKTSYFFYGLLALCVVVSYPTTSQFISRAYADVEPDLKPYTRSRDWLLEANQADVEKRTIKTKSIIAILKTLKNYMPDNECAIAIQAPLIMLHGQRVIGQFHDDYFITSVADIKKHYSGCRFIIVMDMESHLRPFYPIEHILNDDDFKITPLYETPRSTKKERRPLVFLIEQLYLDNGAIAH